MRGKQLGCVLSAVLLAILPGSAAGASLIVLNDDFDGALAAFPAVTRTATYGGTSTWAATDAAAAGFTANGDVWYGVNLDQIAALTWSPIDTSPLQSVWLSIDLGARSPTGGGFESSDSLEILVNGTRVDYFQGVPVANAPDVLANSQGAQLSSVLATFVYDITALVTGTDSVVIQALNNVDSEHLAFDNVIVGGVAVPEPASFVFWMLATAGGSALVWVRRRRGARA